MNVEKTKEIGLCTSCEICHSICPAGAIGMKYEYGQFFPTINKRLCTDCSACLNLCPGIDVETIKYENESTFERDIAGVCLESYTAYSKNDSIWTNSTSGGIITDLIINLLKNKEFDGAFVLKFDTFNSKPARLTLENEEIEVLKAAKSKYIPASVYNVIETLKVDHTSKYIIVVTPCQAKGIKKFLSKMNIGNADLLFLGLFCDKTLNFNAIKYIENKYKKQKESLIKFDFRNKQQNGWPGNPKLYFDTGKELIIDRSERTKIKPYFQLESCLYCTDKLNRESDISFGDCYIKGKNPGKSSVIIRTEKGKNIFEKYMCHFNIEESHINSIIESQELHKKVKNLSFAKLLKTHNSFFDYYPGKSKRKIRVELFLKKIQINMGKTNNKNKIRASMFISTTVSKIRSAWNIAKTCFSICLFFLKDSLNNNMNCNRSYGNNVIIVGGELFNKGAQAMTFTVVDQVKRRYPHKTIYLFSKNDFERDKTEKEKYNFEIIPNDFKTRINILASSMNNTSNSYPHNIETIIDVFKNTSSIIDISGYALYHRQKSVFDLSAIDYLLNIMIAKKFSIAFFIFPQSIGPFKYSFKEKIVLFPFMKRYLKYPQIIFVRENDGMTSLLPFTDNNVKKLDDIVLLNDGYKMNNIFRRHIELRNVKIHPNSIGIFPNKKVLDRMNSKTFYSTYKFVIDQLLNSHKCIYIFRHSFEDLAIGEGIKNLYHNNPNVKLIKDDFNAIELENIIKQFDFIIASRYHSIIHAYKSGIPALVIGWANKYFELMDEFNQLDYFHDVNGLDTKNLLNSCGKLLNNYKKDSQIIISKMNEKIKNEAFEELQEI